MQILQHSAHHALHFESMDSSEGGRPRPRLALIQSMTPNEFDLAPGSAQNLELLELPHRLVLGDDIRSRWPPEVVHSSIVVVDPLTGEILHHQVRH